tara:strand:- start:560 stop:793 length:234 start_codon:yes stop_codon:yes gene_type:complete
MTTLTQTWGYTCRACDAVASFLIGFGKSIHNSIALSRQVRANEYIAKQILIEYPHHTYQSLLFELNQKTLKEFAKDA